jgi:hypothetical protein
MKPKDKVVSAEDITSSLYFLHVVQPEDDHLVAPPQFQEPNYREQGPIASGIPPAQAVHRKAVPGTSMSQDAGGFSSRKPLSGALAPMENSANRQNMSAGSYSQKSGMLAPDYISRQSLDSSHFPEQNNRTVPSAHRPPERSRPAGTSLTLIRRDPASGAQWNVARIDDPNMVEISSLSAYESGTKRQIGAPMWIDVTNPGYSKFLHSNATGESPLPTRPSNMAVQSSQIGVTPQPRMPLPSSENQASDSMNTFRRRLWMEGTQYTGSGFGHRKSGSHDFNSGRPGSRGSYDARTDRPSLETRPNPSPSFLTRDDQTYSTIQVSEKQTSFRGYVFTSPWNGRCEFITGAGGGTLKVRHITLNPT